MNSIHNTSVDKFVSEILNSNISYLSRAITLVESNNSKHQAKANLILEQCLPHSNKSVRIGITGVPGVGKSTFIEVFGKYLTRLGKKVAVLAIDPSSSIQKGSILGDKTRMETLVNDENAFIRPSPSGESLGGVARKTRETITLCEAAGFDVIIIETVGVGQSETTVHSMVDFFLLLKLANAGDELQGIKRGIIEMADAIAINKADGLNVKETNLAKTEFANVLMSFVQDIPYALVLQADCDISNYMDDVFVYNYLSEGGKCIGYEKFGVLTPTEFIYNTNGDCDTRTIFSHLIFKHFGYEVAIFNSNVYAHSIFGIHLDSNNTKGAYKLIKDKKYFLWETTSKGFKIGEIPSEIGNLNYWYQVLN